jgi:thermopsin
MRRRALLNLGFTAIIATIVLTSGLVVLGSARGAVPTAVGGIRPTSVAASAGAATGDLSSPLLGVAARIHSTLAADHVPAADVFLPNFNAHVSIVNHTISPEYPEAPAPMGIGDFGVQLVGGKNVGTVAYTSSDEGIVRLDALNSTYIDGNGPDTVDFQLNTYLTHVDLFGNSSYQFWIQNVPVYIPHLDQLSILDNIWNVSNPAINFTANALYRYDGTVYPGVLYYDSGPTFHTAMPFTVRLYNNATVFHNRPTVFFNYSLTEANGTTVSGSYDQVEFNSTGLQPARTPAPSPTFQIDGKQLGPSGFVPNDAELVLTGAYDGLTTSISNVQGTMQLLTLPNASSVYRSVPSAYNFGISTGETSEGMAEWASNGTVPEAHLGPGPSFLGPLWGLQGASFGHVDQRLNVSPSNAFVFVSVGSTFHRGTAQWAPLPVSGSITYELPSGTYSYDALLSEYRAVTFTLTGSTAVTRNMVSDPSLGVYTPLWAWDNGQLAAISQPGGMGSRSNPYVLYNQPATLNPLFNQFNPSGFPVFSGIFLSHTTDYVSVESPPSFLVEFSSPAQLTHLDSWGLPTFNYLQLEFENTSNVSLVDGWDISGWFPAYDLGIPLASVMLWNSSHDLIAQNTFDDMGVSVDQFGGRDNTFWGNNFSVYVPPCPYPEELLNYGDQAGLELFASGDLTYNNYFALPLPAFTPGYNPTTYWGASFHDSWNVTPEPASAIRWVNGWPLSGSILGTAVQGGNFWSNYGTPSNPYGVFPYNDSGQITHGGDRAPLLPFALHEVIFTEKGLGMGGAWLVTVDGYTQDSQATTVTFWEPSGLYAYLAEGNLNGTWISHPGAFDVTTSTVHLTIHFS